MAEWPLPSGPREDEAHPRGRGQIRRATRAPGRFAPAGFAPPRPPEDDEAPSARILPWPGPRPVPEAGTVLAEGAAAARARRQPPRALLAGGSVVLVLWALTTVAPALPVSLLDRATVAAAAWSPLALIPSAVLVAFAVTSRAWVSAAACVLAAALPWIFVATYAVPGEAPPTAGTSRLAVLLLDADGGHADAPSVVAAVARQPVDVLVVTEATPMLTHALTTAGLDPRLAARWVSAPPGSARGGIVVYSRYALVTAEPLTTTRWPGARITLDTGRARVSVVVGRASPPSEGTARWRSDLSALGTAARTGAPAVLVGSLDATPEQAPFRALTTGGLQDAAAALGRGWRPTWPSWSVLPLLPLDHVVVGGGVGVRSVGTVPVAGTAHRGIVADLVVPPAGPREG